MTISLDDMSALAHALRDAEVAVEDAEQRLKDAKERERLLREETIPSAMQELELKELVLESGETISVKQEVYASIPKANQQPAFKWLDDNGFGGLIKVEVSVVFGKGEKDDAIEFADHLRANGMAPEFSEGVHAQTLKAFLKEQIAEGRKDLPLELFGARPVWTAKVSKK